jgi:hypothetical protein
MANKNLESKTLENKSLGSKIRESIIDAVKISAVSGALAFVGLTKDCAKLPERIGIDLTQMPSLTFPLLAFDFGAGAFAGYKDRIAASIAIYGATLIPEIYDIFNHGDLTEVGKRALAKTIVYGGGYALGHIFK